MRRLALPLLASTLLLLAVAANAAVLWDQSTIDPFDAGYFDMVAGGPPFGSTVYTVSDVTVPAPGWVVSSVAIYASNFDFDSWAGITTARLNIFPKSGPAPLATNDPTLGTSVPVVLTSFGDYWEIKATGLSNVLPPGDYWIGLTPNAPNANELHIKFLGAGVGSPSYSWDKFGFPAPSWGIGPFPGASTGDASFKVEGVVSGPVPTAKTTWARVKTLYR